MSKSYDKFFEHFSIQRNMYFNTCKITNYGSYYFSSLIEDDCYWNYFVPLSYEKLINNLADIEKTFIKANRKLCIGVSDQFEDYEKLTNYFNSNNYHFVFSESWLIYDNQKIPTVNYKIVNSEEDYNLFKYILLKTYSNPPSLIQPWGNISNKYLEALEKKKYIDENTKHIILYQNDDPIAACSICIEDDISAIYNLAILPAYQSNEDGYSVLLGAVDVANKLNAKELFIQIPTNSNVEKWLLNNHFKPLMIFNAYSPNN